MSGKPTITGWALFLVLLLIVALAASAFLIDTPIEMSEASKRVEPVTESPDTRSEVRNTSREFTRDSLATLAGSADNLGPISSLLIYQEGELIE